MKTQSADTSTTAQLLDEVTRYLAADELCLEIRHYPSIDAAPDSAANNKLHLFVIMQREITQQERRQYMDKLNDLARQHDADIDCIFSSPKVWRDLRMLVSPFTRVERDSVIVWQR